MAARHVLDTNVLILALRGNPQALNLIDQLRQEGDLCVSVVTRTEILAGMHPHEERPTMALLASLRSLPLTTNMADHAGRWIYDHARKGIQISFPDALIAATVVEHGLTLVTTNAAHFPMLTSDQVQEFQPVT